MNDKTIIEFGFLIMKNYGDRRGCYPPWPTADTQPHSLIDN